jgi:tRNA (guanine37-N1)-methyltransferase
VRLLPGVLGHADSSRYESFSAKDETAETDDAEAADVDPQAVPRTTHASAGLLDYPHYTRPADFNGHAVPAVLADGDHVKIRQWRRHAALAKTLANRPDLLADATLEDEDRRYLASLGYNFQ